MQLDAATLTLTLVSVTMVLGALMGTYGLVARSYPGFAAWTIAYFTYSGGFFLLSLRGKASPYLTVVVANVLLTGSAALVAHGVRRFYLPRRDYSGRDLLDRALVLLNAAAFLWLVYAGVDATLRSLLYSSVVAVIYARVVFVPVGSLRSGMRPADWFLTASMLLVVVVQVLRVRSVASLPAHAEPLRDDPSLAWNLYVAILLAIFSAIAFLELMYMRMSDELIAANARLQEMSETDPLTGLAIRRRFDPIAEAAFLSARRYRQPLSIMMFDIDHFKRVNDEYGHEAGDRVLVEVARCARGTMRDADLVARMGGEEFLALLPQTSLAETKVVAERLVEALSAGDESGAPPIHVTLSIGIVELQDQDDSVATLVRRADVALYRAKREGRNRIHCDGLPAS